MLINDIHDKDILSFYIYIILLSKQKKTTTDKHDTHSNQYVYSAKNMTLMFDFYDIMQSLL